MARLRRVRHNSRVPNNRFFAIAALIATLVTGCSAPSQKYGASKSEGVFFTVPNGWHEITTDALNKFEGAAKDQAAKDKSAMVKWQVAFSSGKEISPSQVFSLKSTDNPVAFARVRTLYPGEANAVSYNILRNIIVPLTEWVNNPTDTTPVYDIIDDYEVVEKGARGVRTIYSFTDQGISQTFDQTAMISEDRQKIYLFIIRCSTDCYNKNEKVMTKISNSFTVRGNK